jgi:hypothetical protein
LETKVLEVLFVCAELKIEPRTSHIPDKHSTEQCPQSFIRFYKYYFLNKLDGFDLEYSPKVYVLKT